MLKDKKYMLSITYGCLIAIFGWFISSFVIVSKPLWIVSCVLILSGIFMISLPVFDYIINDFNNVIKFANPIIVLGTHSMLTYFISGNVEAILNFVKIGDKNLYHILWKKIFYSKNYVLASCLLCSIVVILIICSFVYKINKRRRTIL